jgi:hypothetical protein
LKQSGKVIVWGDSRFISQEALPHIQKNVIDIFGIDLGFGILKSNHDAVCWGFDIRPVQFQSDVKKIFANSATFALLKNDGSVFTCGSRILTKFFFWGL